MSELQHFGVKGMKWGVRRYQNDDGSLTPAGQKRQQVEEAKVLAKQKGASAANALVIAERNAKQGKVDAAFLSNENISQKAKDKVLKTADKAWSDNARQSAMSYGNEALASKEGSAALSKAYNSLVKAGLSGRALNNGLQQSIAGIIDKAWTADKNMYSPSGTKRLSMLTVDVYGDSYLAPSFVDVDKVKHSSELDDEDDEDDEMILFKFDPNSKLLIRHGDSIENTLAHFGVKGMKWGVRRAAGTDGSVGLRTKPTKVPSNRRVKSQRRKDAKNRRKLSDQELMEKIGRLEKEKKLRELTDADIRPGKKAMGDILKTAGAKTLTTVAAGATLYGVKYILTGKVDPSDLAGYVAPKPGKK